MANLEQGDQQSSTRAMERKTIEKNRRIHMKNLYSQLNSLLPNNNNPRGESLSRVDQIDGAINHIKNLETKVKIAEKHRESLRERKRSRSGCSSSSETRKVEVHEMGSFLRITLVCDYEDQFILREIIRMLNEDNIEVKSVHSSLTSAISSLHVLNAEIQQSYNLGTSVLIERLKIFVNGHG
ncbi:transcription factor bHLH162-like [Vigna radiata var. radiata]|uniref:Transcription factor bHLH162-like n=1 Tax=Vigna radiata var. radiata TaxID=3916 RepID=A0A1S3TD46_VIGRR|nr:transcription factor bHLH162-like [Vigna radiata var. radiata]